MVHTSSHSISSLPVASPGNCLSGYKKAVGGIPIQLSIFTTQFGLQLQIFLCFKRLLFHTFPTRCKIKRMFISNCMQIVKSIFYIYIKKQTPKWKVSELRHSFNMGSIR